MLAGFAVLALTAAAWFAGTYHARLSGASDQADLSASEAIDLRFPDDWRPGGASAREDAFASSDALWFQPTPLYPIKSAADLTAFVREPEADMPEANTKPLKAAAHARRRSNAVLSEAQLAGIKNRLNLTPEQERYWPAIAAELRKMEYRKEADAQGVHTASVDTSKMDVAKLKSAGLPLVMSFDDEQKDQFKGLVHLLGIESALPGL
jgi:hypothetical protein